jgi:RNA polymerase sigma-70 factor (ECF subfamily)
MPHGTRRDRNWLIEDNELMEFIKGTLLHSTELDKLSFERIYKQHWSSLYSYAFNVLRENELCEDIVQEVFMDLWRRRQDVHISDLRSYLYQSVKYQIFNHFRESRYKKQLLMEFDLVHTECAMDETFEAQELEAQIKDAISQLPKRRRIVFDMSRNEGLSNKEISEELDISLQTVKNQISESLKFIRKSLNSMYLSIF